MNNNQGTAAPTANSEQNTQSDVKDNATQAPSQAPATGSQNTSAASTANPGASPSAATATPAAAPSATPTETFKTAEELLAEYNVTIPDNMEFLCNVPVGKGGDRTLTMHLVKPKEVSKPMPALVYIFGGGWNHGTKDKAINSLVGYVKRGYIGVAIEYRLTHEAIFPAQLEDCKTAIRHLRANAEKYGIDPDHIGVWGSSAGGHLAALLGTTGDVAELEGDGGNPGYSSRVQAVVDFSGPADFLNYYAHNYSSVTKLLGHKALDNKENTMRAMPGTYATPDDPPFFIVHGDADTTVPYSQSVTLYEQLKAAGIDATLTIVPGAGHSMSDHPDAKEISAKAWEFLDKHLKGK